MIILVKTVNNEILKAYIKDSIFFEVDELNKKQRQITKSSIASILSLYNGKMEYIRTDEWLEKAQKQNFWK